MIEIAWSGTRKEERRIANTLEVVVTNKRDRVL
jgi:hypothetical protein